MSNWELIELPQSVRRPWELFQVRLDDDPNYMADIRQRVHTRSLKLVFEQLTKDQQQEFVDISILEVYAFCVFAEQHRANNMPDGIIAAFDSMSLDSQRALIPHRLHDSIYSQGEIYFEDLLAVAKASQSQVQKKLYAQKARRLKAKLNKKSEEKEGITFGIQRKSFSDLVRSITRDTFNKKDLRFKCDAMNALQVASEAYLTEIYESSYSATLHAKRKLLKPEDMRLARRLSGDRA